MRGNSTTREAVGFLDDLLHLLNAVKGRTGQRQALDREGVVNFLVEGIQAAGSQVKDADRP